MKAQLLQRDNCRLCSSRKMELVVELAPIPLAEKYTASADAEAYNDSYPIDLYMCTDCGHVQCLDVIDSENLWDDYTYHSAQTKGIVEHFQEVAKNVCDKFQPTAGSLVIDVGSNDGSLLRPFKDRGYRVLGIDPAREIARKATESGIETIPSLLTAELAQEVWQKYGPANVVTAFNVFAHADDMSGMADSIRSMLGPDGVFIFEVQYLLDIVDKMLLGTIFHEHMSHHSLKPMQKFLEQHGMELIDVERVSIQKGSIIGVAQLKGGPRQVQKSVGDLLALEESRQLDRPSAMREFGAQLGRMRAKMSDLLAQWSAEGATVAGFGAARSGPTYIVQLGLDDALTCIFDDHPQKVNKFSPGHRIPVVATSELYTRKPDYVVILAFLHAKKIIAAHRKFLEDGGRFVVVCPDIQIIDADSPPVL